MLERLISSGSVSALELAKQFQVARAVKDIPGLLGLHNHPELHVWKTMPPWKLRKILANVVYRGDYPNLFRSFSAAMKVDNVKNVDRARLQASVLRRQNVKRSNLMLRLRED